MDAGGEVAQLLDRRLRVGDRAVDELARARRSSSKRSRASWSSIISETSRCCAPSCRSRPSRRRSASPASTIRARDARSASSRARSSTSSRSFSSASAAAPAASRSSSGFSSSSARGRARRRAGLVVDLGQLAPPASGDAPRRGRRSARRQPVQDRERGVAERGGQRVPHAARVRASRSIRRPTAAVRKKRLRTSPSTNAAGQQRERGEERELATGSAPSSAVCEAAPW